MIDHVTGPERQLPRGSVAVLVGKYNGVQLRTSSKEHHHLGVSGAPCLLQLPLPSSATLNAPEPGHSLSSSATRALLPLPGLVSYYPPSRLSQPTHFFKKNGVQRGCVSHLELHSPPVVWPGLEPLFLMFSSLCLCLLLLF